MRFWAILGIMWALFFFVPILLFDADYTDYADFERFSGCLCIGTIMKIC